MSQEHEKNHAKALEEKISFSMPPIDCCRGCLLRLAHQELDTTLQCVFAEIRDIAWNGEYDCTDIGQLKKRLIKIGKIADAFRNLGQHLPRKW